MKTAANTKFPNGTKPAKNLTNALGKSERIKGLIEECIGDLSSVNVVLKQEFSDQPTLPAVEHALERNAEVEHKVQEASGELTVVNQALKGEIHERHVLEFQYAAATEQKDAAIQAALHDPLTGLPNRALFNDRLEHGLAQAKRHGWNLAVMFIDLDDFKSINDSYGHDAGDSVLKLIAQRLKENTRSDDTISRHGGDEFLYLLMETRDEREITLIANKIIKSIQAPCHVGEAGLTTPSIRASIGIAVFPKNGTTAEALIKRADKAMYQAKQDKSGYSFAG